MRQSIIRAVGMVNWSNFAVSLYYCPLCGGKRPFVRLDANAISVRCLFCRATPITLSLVAVLRHIAPDLHSKEVYELSSRGPLVEYLKRKSKSLVCSEYFDGVIPGNYENNVQCQDVQRLTYANERFDICTSTEVFEHVPDDAKGFSEIHRVLKPGGIFAFTVPLDIGKTTVERAMPGWEGEVRHLLPPEYHSDPFRKSEPILAFRNYGYDILEKLVNSGFKRAELRSPGWNMPWGYWRPVTVAYRENSFGGGVDSDPLLIRCVV